MNRDESKTCIKERCGEGWVPLVDSVFDRKPSHVVITDVYQKWGALTFDYEPWNQDFEYYIEEISEKSLKLCEICGAKGEEIIVKGWLHTLCENHYQLKIENHITEKSGWQQKATPLISTLSTHISNFLGWLKRRLKKPCGQQKAPPFTSTLNAHFRSFLDWFKQWSKNHVEGKKHHLLLRLLMSAFRI